MRGEEKSAGHVARTKQLEFGGSLGAPFMVFGLPATVYFINLACSKEKCTIWEWPQLPSSPSVFFDKEATLIFLGWFAFQVALALLPTGSIHEGLPLLTGTKLKYRCNAFTSFVASTAAFGVLLYLGYPVTVVYEKFLQIATAAIVFSLALSILLYVKALNAPNQQLASGGNSGNPVYDFFIGHELNPRIGPLDLKFFCELRPGLIGWVMLDLCFIAKARELYGTPPTSLLLASAFHVFYVADALWHEEAILTTMDIVHDGFGFMLVFGDLVWVPFLYCLQSRFLLEHPQEWSPLALTAILALNLLGFAIFRGSNSQKNDFRKNPQNPALSHLKTLPTDSGKKLLISGWWGMCRHPNYLGDLIMALSWSLPCGFQNILPYFYPIYFLCLLIHRNMRDEVACRSKYGKDWDKYCAVVKYRIFPYIF